MTGKEIIALREKLELSRKQLAQMIKVPYETLCRWENEKRSPSKYYEAQLRELSGGKEFQKLESQWIFKASNIKHIKSVVSMNNQIKFGLAHVLYDEEETIYLATIRLHPNANTLYDLQPFIPISNQQQTPERRQIFGFFIADDKIIRPSEYIETFMNTWRADYVSNCIIYNKAKDDIYVWKLSTSEYGFVTQPIPFIILG